MLKSAIAIRHIHFENLGTFEAVLAGAGYKLHYHDIGVDSLSMLDPVQPDLLIVLGGPVGVYETDAYPFLAWERAVLARHLAAGRPTFGICLGASQSAVIRHPTQRHCWPNRWYGIRRHSSRRR